jgi:hypothetical protein
MRRALRCSAGVFQRGDKIFRALALEFFLGGFEVCNAACDFFPLASEVVLRFGHAHIPFDSCPIPIGGCDWGVNWDKALLDCDGCA